MNLQILTVRRLLNIRKLHKFNDNFNVDENKQLSNTTTHFLRKIKQRKSFLSSSLHSSFHRNWCWEKFRRFPLRAAMGKWTQGRLPQILPQAQEKTFFWLFGRKIEKFLVFACRANLQKATSSGKWKDRMEA